MNRNSSTNRIYSFGSADRIDSSNSIASVSGIAVSIVFIAFVVLM